MNVGGKRRLRYLLTIASVIAFVTAALPAPGALAAQITNRSLTLVAGPSDGGSKPGGVVKHQYAFTIPTGGNIGSIKFQYCTNAAGTCSIPTGLVTTSAALDYENGATGFSLNNTTNAIPYLSRSAANVTSGANLTYRFSGITNPTTPNQAFYVRMFTYTSNDTTGTAVDSGVVAASTATQIVLTGTMPESLTFCTGAAITTTGGVPDCSSATPGSILFNQLFSPADTSTATSQMAASTNAITGYAITVNGTTLTSGANTITAMASATTGVKGSKQFGLNLKANTTATSTVAVGSEVAPVSNGTNFRAQASSGYNNVDNFKFVSGETVADSGSGGGSPGPTDTQLYTVSYITNVSGSTLAGTYTTTLTYICTPTF